MALDQALRINKASLKSNRPINRNNILMANQVNDSMLANLGPTLMEMLVVAWAVGSTAPLCNVITRPVEL